MIQSMDIFLTPRFDKYSYMFISFDLDLWSSTVYTYVFHRHINDGSFHLAEEKKQKKLPGLFGTANSGSNGNTGVHASNNSQLDVRISEILNIAASQVNGKSLLGGTNIEQIFNVIILL